MNSFVQRASTLTAAINYKFKVNDVFLRYDTASDTYFLPGSFIILSLPKVAPTNRPEDPVYRGMPIMFLRMKMGQATPAYKGKSGSGEMIARQSLLSNKVKPAENKVTMRGDKYVRMTRTKLYELSLAGKILGNKVSAEAAEKAFRYLKGK